MTDKEIIALLAEFLGCTVSDDGSLWQINSNGQLTGRRKIGTENWNPLKDWNHWRQVEERVMEDKKTLGKFRAEICGNQHPMRFTMLMKANLPTRCKALISILESANVKEPLKEVSQEGA